MGLLNYTVQDDIAVIEVDNPPVNGVRNEVRIGIWDAILRANNDSNVAAIVLCGRRTFVAGMDLREPLAAKRPPILSKVCVRIENSSKPVVAAISTFALGGGFELALASHYRLAHEKTTFGFPEVDIGLLPSAGGCTRFPRLVGLKLAFELIITGRRFGSKEALVMGVIDKVISGDVVQEAIQFAKSISGHSLEGRRVGQLKVKDKERAVELHDAAVKWAAKKLKGREAPVFCVKVIMTAAEHPLEESLQVEQQYGTMLRDSAQSRALQYAFFADRMAPKWDVPGLGSHKTHKPLHITTGAVIGAGTMGTGIAMTMLNAGISVVLVEQNTEFLDKGVAMLQNLYKQSVRLGKLSAEQAKAALSMLKPSTSYDDLRDVDMVIEAVFEKMSLKKEVFAKLDQVCKPDAVLCSNTSTLSIDQIAGATKRPDKVVGVHYFVPAYYMALLENIRGEKTSAETISTVMKFGTRIGKTPVLVGNCAGFAANRMRTPFVQEAIYLVEEGCLPEGVDRVMEDFGFPLGPLKVADLSGLDIGWAIRKGLGVAVKDKNVKGVRNSSLADSLCEHGRFGRKTGQGWYNYGQPHGKEARNDPWVTALVLKYCEERGIQRRHVTTQEIQERMLYSSINEGFRILEEGICRRPEELDVIWLHGFGFPRHLGGPMHYANNVGIRKVYERIRYYCKQHNTTPHWQPADLLRTVAENDIPFNQWADHIPILMKSSNL